MKIKRILTGALAAALCLSAAACGGNGGNTTKEDRNHIEMYVMDAGYRTEVFEQLAEAFKAHYSDVTIKITPASDINSKLTSELSRKNGAGDIWFAGEQNIIRLVEKTKSCPLTDMTDLMNMTALGEDKTLEEKINPRYKYYDTYKDKYYSISWVYGACGIMYNANYLTEAQEPKTTKQFIELVKNIAGGKVEGIPKSVKPLIWSGGNAAGYMSYAVETWKAQYMGVDKYDAMVNYCDNGNYTYELLNDDGVLYAYQTVKQIADPSYSVDGSSGFQHTPAQQDFLRGAAVFMPNGDWIETEMRTSADESSITQNIKFLPTPIVSELGVKLRLGGANATEAEHETMLIAVVTAIDEGKTDAEIKEAYPTLSDKQIAAVREARSVVYTLGASHRIYIPTYCKAKTACYNFVRFMASDEGIQIFRKYAGSHSPFEYTNVPEDEKLTVFQKSQDKVLKNCSLIYDTITKSPIRAFNTVAPDSGAFAEFFVDSSKTAEAMRSDYYNTVSSKWTAMRRIAGV